MPPPRAGEDDEAAAVAILLEQMTYYVSEAFVVRRFAGELELLERAPQHPRRRRGSSPAARRPSATTSPRRRRLQKATPPSGPAASSSSADGHRSGRTGSPGSRRASHGARSMHVILQDPSVQRSNPSAKSSSFAKGSTAPAAPHAEGGCLRLPNGGTPQEPKFTKCAAAAATTGDDAQARLLQRRVAQLQSLRYETIRFEKQERVERSRNATLAASGGGVQSNVLSGEQMASLMKLEKIRIAHQPAESVAHAESAASLQAGSAPPPRAQAPGGPGGSGLPSFARHFLHLRGHRATGY
ncbi:hypothetical protein T492DRAFT_1071460 [Pavlovales sp. CCMP2436]|nr:hypothetical protein T492DRAFT_1071460 [Pavlovales sp. CCMP2436]|mmetsp:Transcript_47819/g.111625  ORF Transcript_47819/g.111625 Transcript_47819/m.111625 type:complete len:298 (-) Transcript_47819:74-967(-)